MNLGLRNSEGYYDLTAYIAIKRVSNEEQKRKSLVYVCSPFRGDTKNNVSKACRYCKFVVCRGFIPIATHLLFPQFMNDNDYQERQIAMNMGFELLSRCKELWCFGERLSEGMVLEIEKAKKMGKKIRYFTKDCKEVKS